jgi:hypothetical protein
MGIFQITAWAEPVPNGWQGIASVRPPVPTYWHGGPSGDSLIVHGVGATEADAEAQVLAEAKVVLLDFIAKESP